MTWHEEGREGSRVGYGGVDEFFNHLVVSGPENLKQIISFRVRR